MRTSAPALVAALTALVATAAVAAPASAQAIDDVVHLGERYGTSPPPAYFDLKAARPDAFTFSRAWMNRNPRLRRLGDGRDDEAPDFEVVSDRAGGGTEALILGPRAGAVEGTIRVPVLLGMYSDDPTPPFSRDQMQEQFWDGPNVRGGQTITEYYDEVSRGKLNLVGETFEWVQSTRTSAEVTGGVGGIGGGQVGLFIMELLAAVDDGSVDWGLYDNDGPDGVPNSADDDGIVDVLAVLHPTRGGECGGSDLSENVWSHRFSLTGSTDQKYVTSTPSNSTISSVPFVRVDDYTIQPAKACPIDGATGDHPINGIGVFAHELGHGFGLPDLYDTRRFGHEGIGEWGLMGSGSWGCSGGSLADTPCHMSPWTKIQLGWLDPIQLEPGVDHGTLTLSPVEANGDVLRVDAPGGSNEHYLLENRQRLGSDINLRSPGLLIWHVDEDLVLSRWPENVVNAGALMGVSLEQADGFNHLGRGVNRSDAGDPFPGSLDNRSFHTGSLPASLTNADDVSGLTVLGIQLDGLNVSARVLTRFQQITVETVGELGTAGEITVDGAPGTGPVVFESAPFQQHAIEAGGGTQVEPGIRERFQRWTDDEELPRTRTFTTALEDETLTAEYGGLEVRAAIELVGGASGKEPGQIVVTPEDGVLVEEDGIWIPKDVSTTFEAAERQGFSFTEWTGDLVGLPNPTTRLMNEPFEAEAVFDFIYEVPEGQGMQIEAARPVAIQLEALNGAAPIAWTVFAGFGLPEGLTLTESGAIEGTTFETGVSTVRVRATDATGLEALADVTLDVVPPEIAVSDLVGSFLQDGNEPTESERDFLDREGNTNGVYDLGDLRAFLLAHPDLPASAEERALVRQILPVVSFDGGPSR